MAETEADERATFTDVVIALYLEGLPDSLDENDGLVFESGPLAESVIGAFALGCAVGVEYPTHVRGILEQTHEGVVDEVIAECRESLSERVGEAKAAAEPLEAESFIATLVDGLDGGPFTDVETAQNALSMSFEYGCVLAFAERGAAIVVRNEYNRSQDKALDEFEEGHTEEAPEGPDPFHSLQEFATEVMEAYEADIGFDS